MKNISNPNEFGRKVSGTKLRTAIFILIQLVSTIIILSRLDKANDVYFILPLILIGFFLPSLYLVTLFSFISAHEGSPKYLTISKPFIILAFFAGFGFLLWGLSPDNFEFAEFKNIIAVVCGAIIFGAVCTFRFWPEENKK